MVNSGYVTNISLETLIKNLENELFDLTNEIEEQLTFDGSEDILNGHFGWVYEEEFGTYDSYKWSPNSEYIAFIREDQTYVKEYALVDYEAQYPVVKYIRYPKTGEDNPIVSISILDLKNNNLLKKRIAS